MPPAAPAGDPMAGGGQPPMPQEPAPMESPIDPNMVAEYAQNRDPQLAQAIADLVVELYAGGGQGAAPGMPAEEMGGAAPMGANGGQVGMFAKGGKIGGACKDCGKKDCSCKKMSGGGKVSALDKFKKAKGYS